MDSRLIFGIFASVAFLFVRWRWPVVPKWLATFGIVLGVGLAAWSLTAIPIGLALSLILNLALIAMILDYKLAPTGTASGSAASLPPPSQHSVSAGGSESRKRKPETEPTPEILPAMRRDPENKGDRDFLPRKVTADFLLKLREGKTAVQLARATEIYKGKWMTISGVVIDAGVTGKIAHVHIVQKGESNFDALMRHTAAIFEKQFDRVEMLEKGDEVTVCGRLDDVSALGLRLVDCELID